MEYGGSVDDADLPAGLRREDRSPSGYGVAGSGSVLLEFKDADSDKFWGFFEDEGQFLVFWGRNGRRPQKSQAVDAREAGERLREKLGKGYDVSEDAGKLKRAFVEAPEWFENIKEASGGFQALLERSKLRLEIAESDKTRAAAAKARKAFRL